MENENVLNGKRPFWTRKRLIILAVLIALFLRLWAAWQLPLDADEPVYLEAGYDYSRMIASGNLTAIIVYPGNSEHPPLVKILYGLSLLPFGEDPDWSNSLFAGRLVSAFFGVLAVWIVALFSPLAGLALAVQTMVVKYTSEVYLEALPLFFSLLAIFSLLRSQNGRSGWVWLSALALGLTAAGKYAYFPVLIVVIYILLFEKKYSWRVLFPYLLIAGLSFLVFNPYLWRDPVNRLLDSLFFHAQYSQSQHVRSWNYPWYQPLIWVSRSEPYSWHPDVFFYFGFDGLIALLAMIGLKKSWEQQRWVVIWMIVGMIFLFLWPTKWPQYSLVVQPAFCIASVAGGKFLYQKIHEAEMYWNWLGEMFIRPSKTTILLGTLILVAVTLGEVYVNFRNGWLDRGWSVLNMQNTPLASNTIYDILVLADRKIALAGEGGLALVTLSEGTELPQDWQVFTTVNSPLPSNRVFDIEQDASGALWIATQGGLARFAGQNWRTFTGTDYSLSSDLVKAVEVESNGEVWIATLAGLAVYDGEAWQTYTTSNSGLANDFIIAMAIQKGPGGEQVWVATRSGVSRLDPTKGEWLNYSSQAIGISSGGISSINVDSVSNVWVTTYGSGMLRWDGQSWQSFRSGNSELPSNTVTGIFEIEPGVYWIASGQPAEVGGVLQRFDGEEWRSYTPSNSGYTGAEPLSVALDQEGRLWIGTRTGGVSVYQNP